MVSINWYPITALACIGVLFLLMAWGYWKGLAGFRAMYLFKNMPVVAPREVVYSLLPTGVGFVLFALGGLVVDIGLVTLGRTILWVGLGTGLSSLIFMAWQPDWIKPPWIREFERKNRDILNVFFRETRYEVQQRRQKGDKNWVERELLTEEGLEAWVAEVRRRYHQPNDMLSIRKVIKDTQGEVVAEVGRHVTWHGDPNLVNILLQRYPYLDVDTTATVLAEAMEKEIVKGKKLRQTDEEHVQWAVKVLRQKGLLE